MTAPKDIKATKEQIAEYAENDLWFFAQLINPHYKYGEIHEEVYKWLQGEDNEETKRKLLLLPRGHLKSHCIATWCSWTLTRKPWSTIVYLSATEDLAKGQIYAIKNMMTSEKYKSYWPLMIDKKTGDREVWTAFGFNVDHPERKKRGIRDQSLLVRTIKSNAAGLHCSDLVFDDVVVPSFAYTEIGRRELRRALGQYNSILNPKGKIKAVGTRYHAKDSYQDMLEVQKKLWDKETKEFIGAVPLWDIKEEVVEDVGDGTGTFLWPREVSERDGEEYGLDVQTLEEIRADYFARGEHAQFYAQYYNDPNNIDDQRLSRSTFQYYERKFLEVKGGKVFFKKKRLNTFAAMDVAWTQGERSDYTCIVVIGIDQDGFIYVLDMARFKTSSFQEYYDEVLSLQMQWCFKKLLVETNAGGHYVKQELETIIRSNGGSLTIEGKHRSKGEGTKFERIAAVLESRYSAGTIWHYKGGFTSILEEELILERPPHDDLKDSLAAAISISKPPGRVYSGDLSTSNVVSISRFGGRRGRV